MKMKKTWLLRRFTAAAAAIGLCALTASCGFIVINHPQDQSTDTTAADIGTDSTSAVTTVPDTTTAAPETTAAPDLREQAQARLDTLPDRDYSAANIIIAAVDADVISPSETLDDTDAVRIDTRRAVEDKYNTKIITTSTDISAMLTDAKEAYLADMYYADLLLIPQSRLGSFVASGILANMYSLPFVSFDADWYDQEIMSNTIVGNTLYAVSGAANFSPDELGCIYFNRTLAEKYGIDPYTLVYEGSWTLDKLEEFSKIAAADINGHGTGLSNEDYIDTLASAQSLNYVTTYIGERPSIDFMDDEGLAARASNTVDRIYSLIYGDSKFADSKNAWTLFETEALLFCTDRLSKLDTLPDSQISWGLLPMPKYDTLQTSYISPLFADAPIFCAIANTPSYETSGLILEALNVAAYEYVEDTYMNTCINYRLRDNNSIYMLEYILDGAYCDFPHMFSSGYTTLDDATYTAVYKAVTTRSTLAQLYKSSQSAAKKELSAMKLY